MKAFLVTAMMVVTGGVVQAQQGAPAKVLPPKQATHVMQQHVNEGQRVFEQNCSRCHNPPDGFSPRISSTVVRHMRVRANLSEADMKALEKFFHP
jgi:cytochrome c5